MKPAYRKVFNPTLRICLSVLLLFSFLVSRTYAAQNPVCGFIKNSQASKVQFDQHAKSHPGQVPVPAEPDQQDESDLEDISDKEKDYLPFLLETVKQVILKTPARSQFHHFERTFQNRSSIPLFILFSSWKSYLG